MVRYYLENVRNNENGELNEKTANKNKNTYKSSKPVGEMSAYRHRLRIRIIALQHNTLFY